MYLVNNLFKLLCCYFIILTVGCNQKKSRLVNQEAVTINCSLVNESFDISFPLFSEKDSLINDFFDSNHTFDMIYIRAISGGEKSRFLRFFKTKNEISYLVEEKGGLLVKKKVGGINQEIVDYISDSNSLKEFVQVCTNNQIYPPFSNYFFIRKNGKKLFKYYASSSNFQDLNHDSKIKIQKEIRLLKVIKDLSNLGSY